MSNGTTVYATFMTRELNGQDEKHDNGKQLSWFMLSGNLE
jgi:hypothetical protein